MKEIAIALLIAAALLTLTHCMKPATAPVQTLSQVRDFNEAKKLAVWVLATK